LCAAANYTHALLTVQSNVKVSQTLQQFMTLGV